MAFGDACLEALGYLHRWKPLALRRDLRPGYPGRPDPGASMPILDVQIVAGSDEPEGLARRIADAAAPLLAPGRQGATWVRLHRLSAADYAEDGGAPAGVLPVFCSVPLARLPDPAGRARLAAALTPVLAGVCGRPAEHVHLLFEPDGAGRVAFGGRLVPPDAGSSSGG